MTVLHLSTYILVTELKKMIYLSSKNDLTELKNDLNQKTGFFGNQTKSVKW